MGVEGEAFGIIFGSLSTDTAELNNVAAEQ